MMDASPTERARRWLARFGAALESGEIFSAAALFAEDSYWRDLVAFTWNIKTLEGRDEIGRMLTATLKEVRPAAWEIEGTATGSDGIVEAWFTFEMAVARGKGHLRLKGDQCRTLLTTMQELKGHEERKGERRDKGVEHRAAKGRKNWLQRKNEEEAELGYAKPPYCVIIGGGQGGIALGARLKRLDVPTIILEKNAKAGDSWRNRYASLVLHDPVWYDHLPYLPFPDDWPVFAPKDKIGDWLEAYAKIMDLNYWTSSECTGARYDRERQEWTIAVTRHGRPVELRARQLVFATGAYGPPNEIALAGAGDFKGDIYHSSRYVSGEAYAGKACVVIGSNSSAHDICADLWEHGADVTMVQRSPTTVVKSETLMNLGFASLYSEAAAQAGITTDMADLLFASLPFKLMPSVQIPLYQEIARRDAEFYERLGRAGFLIDFGEDGSGLMMKALRSGSGYYIDVGASDLIANGEVKLRSGVGVKQVKPGSVELTGGTELPADLIVCATGFQSMNGWVARIVSHEVADRVGPCWGLGSNTHGDPGPWQGELRNMWKPTRQEALWFHGGNLHLSRHYSQFLALQLKARMEGIATPVYAG